MSEPEFVDVGRAEVVPPGSAQLFYLGGRPILVANQGGVLYAMPAGCPHRRWLLTPNELCDGRLKCPRHGWEFEVASGQGVWPPFGYRLRHLPVRVLNEMIQVAWVEPETELAH